MAWQSDDGIVLGGRFSSVSGWQRGNIARLKPDGTLDTGWNPNANNMVSALAAAALRPSPSTPGRRTTERNVSGGR